MDPWCPIGPSRSLVDGPDPLRERLVLPGPGRGWTLPPRIVPAGGDIQHTAHRGSLVHGLVVLHEPEDFDGVELVSLANQAAAFFRISRSSRRILISRRSLVSSSRSSVVSPSARRPSSRSACLTQFRIACAVGSNCFASDSGDLPDRTSSTSRRRYSGVYGWWRFGIVGPPFSQMLRCPRKWGKDIPSRRRCARCGARVPRPLRCAPRDQEEGRSVRPGS